MPPGGGGVAADGHSFGDSAAIAGPTVQFDDFLLLQFVLRPNDHPGVISSIFQIVDDHPFYFRTERSHKMRNQIMSERALFADIAHEHGDRAAHGLVDINDEH